MELIVDLRTQDEFRSLLEREAMMLSPDQLDALGHQMHRDGCIEPLTGQLIPPGALTLDAPSWREGLVWGGISSRVRAVMHGIEQVLSEQQLIQPRIYAAEAVTTFALRLRGLYPRFLGSEFTLDQQRRHWLYPIPCEDLQRLSLPSSSFDIVTTNEVLEHVPSIDRALAEIHRVLRPGGWHIGTVPFLYFADRSERRASLNSAGKIIHLLPPEYHGDPMSDAGVLVFELPGWDIIARARAIGFQDSFMRFMISTRHAVLSEHIGGVLLFCCRK